MKRGQTTISVLIAGVTFAGGILFTYFTSQASQTEKINEAKTEVFGRIGDDRERISRLEEAVTTIKSDTSEIKNDIKTIIKQTK